MSGLTDKVLEHLKNIEGSTAWAMRGAVGAERFEISRVLYRLKRNGLVKNDGPYWKAVKP